MKDPQNPDQGGHGDGDETNRDLESILLPGDLPENPEVDQKRDFDAFMESLRHSQTIDLSDLSDDDLPPNFKSTSTFKAVVQTIDRARHLEVALALITGTHGAGKSTAVRVYGRKEPIKSWECKPGYHERHLMRDIIRELGISAGEGWFEQSSIVADQMKANPRTVVLDEAQRLNYAGLDLLKYLADASSSTFVLVASPSLEKRIDRWPDIKTRCTVRAHVADMDVKEFTALYKTDGYSSEALVELYGLSKGVMRTIAAIMRQIDLEIEFHNTRTSRRLERKNLTVPHVRRIAKKVTG